MIWVMYLIFAAFALYVLLPFFDRNFRGKKVAVQSPEEEDLAYRKEEVLGVLNDLEYDFHLKKISEPDYLQLKERLTQDYINIKKKLDQFSRHGGKQHAGGSETKQREPQRVGS